MSTAQPRVIRRVFIANRGEIARRIALTARRLGIESVALSDQEPAPAYLAEAVTEVHRLPPGQQESPALYLDPQAMLAAAKAAGCDSVHPGFGFLSENAAFAAATAAAGLTWIGPNPAAIAAMASKATARDHAVKAGVPVIAGLGGLSPTAGEAAMQAGIAAFAQRVGYPLLIKAALGGGGKGMRVVTRPEELAAAASRAASEALNSFGDASLVVEQYLAEPRHVEVQVLADRHGQVVAVGDRDCSLQRRHQKVIEEAPAPALGPKTRQALHSAAVTLARAVGYDSTGTVEFLVDWSPATRREPEQSFYFLEMNTRLQVEHPVTEEVFGLDLVEWQFRVARGEALPAEFATLAPRGHSVEARLYAEDVDKDFFPSPGPIAAFLPATGPGLRWEVGLDQVDEVTGRFDPMVAKLVATAATRGAALARLADGLARTVLAGPPNNIPFLRAVLTQSKFIDGPVSTAFLGAELADLKAKTTALMGHQREAAEAVLAAVKIQEGAAPEQRPAASQAGLGFDSGHGEDIATASQRIFNGPTLRPATAAPTGPMAVSIASRDVQQRRGSAPQVTFGRGEVSGGKSAPPLPFWYASMRRGHELKLWAAVDGGLLVEQVDSGPKVRRGQGAGKAGKGGQGAGEILAPVPGKVIAVPTAVNQALEMGQTVVVLESMKMEFEVKASHAGILTALAVKVGDQVTSGQCLGTWTMPPADK